MSAKQPVPAAVARNVLDVVHAMPRIDWAALLSLALTEGATVWAVVQDVRAGMSLPDLLAKYGAAATQLVQQIMAILGVGPNAVPAASRAIAASGNNYTLLVILDCGGTSPTVTLTWPMTEDACRAVADAFAQITSCTTVAYGDDFGPTGDPGDFTVLKGTVNGISAD